MDKDRLIDEIKRDGRMGKSHVYWEDENVLVLEMDVKTFCYEENFDELMKEKKWDEGELADNIVRATLSDILFCYDERDMDSWSWARSRLRLCCARKDYDDFAIQKSTVYQYFLDVKLFARVLVGGRYMVEIPEDSLKKWKKSKEKVFERARQNSYKEIQLAEIERKYSGDIPVYHMTTNHGMFGSSVIVYQKKLSKICDMLGSDIIIMPYTKDEVIIVPKYLKIAGERDEVRDMGKVLKELHEENNRMFSEAKIVSEEIYVYARDDGKIRIYY